MTNPHPLRPGDRRRRVRRLVRRRRDPEVRVPRPGGPQSVPGRPLLGQEVGVRPCAVRCAPVPDQAARGEGDHRHHRVPVCVSARGRRRR